MNRKSGRGCRQINKTIPPECREPPWGDPYGDAWPGHRARLRSVRIPDRRKAVLCKSLLTLASKVPWMGGNFRQVGKDASQKEAEGQASARSTEQGTGNWELGPGNGRLRIHCFHKTKALYKHNSVTVKVVLTKYYSNADTWSTFVNDQNIWFAFLTSVKKIKWVVGLIILWIDLRWNGQERSNLNLRFI